MFVCVYKYYLAKVEDEEIKKFLQHALDLSQQHVQVVTKIFMEEGHAIPLGFTESDVNVDGTALSASPRRDIDADYVRLQGEIGLYAEDGLNLQIKHEWLEKPPYAADRDQLMK